MADHVEEVYVYDRNRPKFAIPDGVYIGPDGLVYKDRRDNEDDPTAKDVIRERLIALRELHGE